MAMKEEKMKKGNKSGERVAIPSGDGTEGGELARRLQESEELCRSLLAERNHLGVQLRESEKRFLTLFEHVAVGMAYVMLDGSWLQVNQKLCDIVGYTREELQGRTFQDITYPDDFAIGLTQMHLLLAGESQISSIEKRYIRKDGSLVWANVTISLSHDAAGVPQHFIVIYEDISERKRGEEEHAQLLLREQAARAEAEAIAEKLTILHKLTDTALAHLTLENMLTELLHRIGDILRADAAAVLLLTDDQRYLKVRAARGLEQEIIERIAVPIGEGLPGRVTLSQEPMVIDDRSREGLIALLLRKKLHSLVEAPLIIEGQVIGIIALGTMRQQRFTSEDALLLQRVADRIALAIDHVRLYEAEQHARAEAMEHAQQLELIIETIADSLFVIDNEGKIVQDNAAGRKIFASSPPVLHHSFSVEERVADIAMRDNQGRPLALEDVPTKRILRGEVLQGLNAVDVIIRPHDAHDIHLGISGAPLRDNKGNITGGVIVARDVTEARHLEQRTHRALERLLTIAGALVQLPESGIGEEEIGRQLADLTCSVLGCQRVGMITVEPESERLHPLVVKGLSAEQERTWWQEQEESNLEDGPDPELIARLHAGEVLKIDVRQPPFVQNSNPYNIKVMLAAPMNIGERLIGILTLDYGGEEHKYTQDELLLAGAIAKLSALVIERQRLLLERVEAHGREMALREANHRMEEFLGIASHELRTPLTTIKANVQLATRRLKSVVQQSELTSAEITDKLEAATEMLGRAGRQIDVLNRLVGDMIDISRIKTGKLQVHLRQEPCNLVTIVREVIQEQQKAVPTRTISIDVPDSETVPVVADPDRIAQVLTNYLTNALKYSTADRPVAVRLELEGKMARVSVCDEGQGLPPEEQQRIWECFYQAQGVKVLSGSGVGLGLGLHISQTIIERHNGQIGVESVPGKGSTFWFTLPLALPGESRTEE